jgi:hypothetical protein
MAVFLPTFDALDNNIYLPIMTVIRSWGVFKPLEGSILSRDNFPYFGRYFHALGFCEGYLGSDSDV